MSVVEFKQGEVVLNDEQRHAELKALAEMSDDEIDFSDLPKVTDWSKAIRGKYHADIHSTKNVAIDTDILEWFGERGLNDFLRQIMLKERTKTTNV